MAVLLSPPQDELALSSVLLWGGIYLVKWFLSNEMWFLCFISPCEQPNLAGLGGGQWDLWGAALCIAAQLLCRAGGGPKDSEGAPWFVPTVISPHFLSRIAILKLF